MKVVWRKLQWKTKLNMLYWTSLNGEPEKQRANNALTLAEISKWPHGCFQLQSIDSRIWNWVPIKDAFPDIKMKIFEKFYKWNLNIRGSYHLWTASYSFVTCSFQCFLSFEHYIQIMFKWVIFFQNIAATSSMKS